MDHMKILGRAWNIVWQYRMLWVFGIILALTTGGGGNGGVNFNLGSGDFSPGRGFRVEPIPPEAVGSLVALILALVCVLLLLGIIAAVAQFVAETALIRLVDDYEQTGVRHSLRQGFRLGWSRTALRLFLIELITGLPLVIALILLLLLAASPLLLWTTQNRTAGIAGTVIAIGLILLVVLLAIIVFAVLSLLMRFFWRSCALEGSGVIDSIRQGYGMVRRNLKDAAVMWLIMFGAGIVWVILLIPVVLLLLFVGAMLGGVPALVVGGLASQFTQGAVPWILAALVGLPILIVVLVVPLAFLGGLWQVFQSSVWTLTYRELRGVGSVQP